MPVCSRLTASKDQGERECGRVVRNAGSTCGCDARPRQPPEGVSISPSQSGETEELLLHRREFYPVELRGTPASGYQLRQLGCSLVCGRWPPSLAFHFRHRRQHRPNVRLFASYLQRTLLCRHVRLRPAYPTSLISSRGSAPLWRCPKADCAGSRDTGTRVAVLLPSPSVPAVYRANDVSA